MSLLIDFNILKVYHDLEDIELHQITEDVRADSPLHRL
jgi:hypothetical protein